MGECQVSSVKIKNLYENEYVNGSLFVVRGARLSYFAWSYGV